MCKVRKHKLEKLIEKNHQINKKPGLYDVSNLFSKLTMI